MSFVVSMVATIALIPLLARASARLGMLDEPSPRKVHDHPVPRVGGLAMLAGLLLSLTALQIFPRPILGILLGAVIVVAMGAWDDRSPLSYRAKFVAQFLAAIIVVVIGGIEITQIVIVDAFTLPRWLSAPLTVLVLVALTNAINLSDGLDGLAGGISFICTAALGVLAYSTGNTPAMLFAIALCGALLGFLRFNTHPARVFMGDGGSQLLGLSIASLGVLVTQNESSLLSATMPLFLLAIPILDTAFVVMQRLREGRSPFLADRNHLHHRLLKMGLHHGEAVTAIYTVQALLFAAAYLLRYASDLVNLGAFLAVGCMLLLTLDTGRMPRLVRTAGRYVVQHTTRRTWLSPTLRERGLARGSAYLLYAALTAYCALAAAVLETPLDITVLLGALFLVVLVVATLHAERAIPVVTKGAAYVLAAVLAYLFADAAGVAPLVHRIEMLLIVLIAVATAAALRFADRSTFELTPMDLLVLFMAIVVPNLPGTEWAGGSLPALAARIAVLFYALELVLRDGREQTTSSPVFALVVLGAFAIKGLV